MRSRYAHTHDDGEKKKYISALFFFLFIYFSRCVARLFALVGSICRSVGQMMDCPGVVSAVLPRPRTRHRRLKLKRLHTLWPHTHLSIADYAKTDCALSSYTNLPWWNYHRNQCDRVVSSERSIDSFFFLSMLRDTDDKLRKR